MTDSVNELIKTREGQRYLAELQKQNWKDLLQPNDPRFEQVYGEKLRNNKRVYEKNKNISKDAWEEKKIRDEFKKRKESGHMKICKRS